MKKRQLGAGGPMVSEIGLGAMSFAGTSGETDVAASHRTLDLAQDLGVDFIDTALIYGPYISESVIGDYFRKNASARKRFTIATKGGIVPNPRGVDNTKKFLTECLNSSLQRLGWTVLIFIIFIAASLICPSKMSCKLCWSLKAKAKSKPSVFLKSHRPRLCVPANLAM